MGSYNHIMGVIHCDSKLSEDVTKMFANIPTEDEYWHRNAGEDYLFSLSIREQRIDLFLEALTRIAKVKSMDPVDGEWFFIDGLVTFEYESMDAVSHIKFANGKTSEFIFSEL